ncbi:MAG: glycosyltransferase family 4 protein [Nitrospirota bacterium]
MKIAMLTGSYPPDVCGVGDYTNRLTSALERQGIRTEVIHDADWRLLHAGKVLKRIRSLRADLVHIQYPTVGFGAHLTPQFLSLLTPCIITLHEISQAHVLRRLALYPFSLRSRHIIITTDFDRRYAISRAPWIRRRSSVIPVGSNIVGLDRSGERTRDDIVYFGMIRPERGIEEVLKLASLVKDRGLPFTLRLVGTPHPNANAYFGSLQKRSRGLPVIWDVGLSDEKVAELLAHTRIAYMPFPDGASERRTSLFALLGNGVPTITTKGAATPEALEHAVVISQGPQDAIAAIGRIVSDNRYREELAARARTYARHFSWESIAIQHKELYERLLNPR